MEGYALTALASVVVTGVGSWLILGRNALTRKEHDALCKANQVPMQLELVHLKAWQDRVEDKVNEVNGKVDTSLKMLYKLNGEK